MTCTEVDSAEHAMSAARDDPVIAVAVLDTDERSTDGSVLLVSRLRALLPGTDVAVVNRGDDRQRARRPPHKRRSDGVSVVGLTRRS